MKKLMFSLAMLFVFVVAKAQPANNDCVNAIPLTVNALCSFSTYNNIGATASGVANPGCGNYLGGDVWFTVTVPASGNLTFDTRTGAGTITDLAMAIYSGNCGALTLIECDDDDSDYGLYMPKIDRTGLTPGSTIYIRVWEYGNNLFGNFDICVTEPAGSGPCASIIVIPDCGVNQTVTFPSGSGAWNSGICGSGTPGRERVYAFVPSVTASYFLNITASSGDWMSYGFKQGACNSTGWTCVARTNLTGNYGPLNLTAGVTYYFVVDSESASGGSHIFNIRCPEVPGTYQHPTVGLQGTYVGACMVNTCGGSYTDDGNAFDYSNNINSTYRTFCPDEPGKCLRATVTMLDIEGSAGCANDAFIIRDGPTQGSPMIWGGCGNWSASLPMSHISTNSSGCLTFQFWSNASITRPGWHITFDCIDCGMAITNNDCETAIPICGATNMNASSPGPGITSTCGGCNLSENYSNWYYFEITESGRMALDLKPENFFEDYDFALYQATDCATLGNPIRCSYAMSPTYCRTYYNAGFSTFISNVTFNTISNTTSTTAGTAGHYANFTNISTTVNEGSVYNLSVVVHGGGGGANAAYVTAWFDWNKNLQFDAGELYNIGTTNANPGTVNANITIPLTAKPGFTGFRVFSNRGSYQTNPCAATPTGEAETYSIFINDGTHCSNNVIDADEEGVDCGGSLCVSCSAANWPTNTGMNSVALDHSEDVLGDSWVHWMNVNAGESYYLMINNWSPGANGFDLVWQFSEGGAMDCDIVLPVELVHFKANCQDDETVVKWAVASETNNDYFVLLKSYNGIGYGPVDTIRGRGTANTYKEYEVRYQEEQKGNVYYKLKQIDFDGEFTYTKMIAANCSPEPVVDVFPNPTDGLININVVNSFSENAMVLIYDNIGQLVYSENITMQFANQIDISTLPKGTYHMIVKSDDMLVNKRIVKK